jgi:hypothetical protein
VNRVVARYADGRLLKGMTGDFAPGKALFHLSETGAPSGTPPVEVALADLKAVFFVKDFAGNPEHHERKIFDPLRPPAGRKLRVVFNDGEVIVGSTTGYQPDRPGFFLEPADPQSNNERCYVIAAATREVRFL